MFITKKQFYDLVPPKGWDEIYKEMASTYEKILLRYFSCAKFGGFDRPALYMVDKESFTNDQGGLFRYIICRYYMEKVVPHCSRMEVLFTYDKKGVEQIGEWEDATTKAEKCRSELIEMKRSDAEAILVSAKEEAGKDVHIRFSIK